MALGPYMGSTGHVRAERLRSDAKYCQWPIPRPDQTYLEQRHAAPSRGDMASGLRMRPAHLIASR